MYILFINRKLTWGMARLAMVRPETISDLRSVRLYLGPHSSMGNMYCAPRINFTFHDWPLNWRRGSSGKKVSLRRVLSFSRVLRWGGGATRCTSVSMAISTASRWSELFGSIMDWVRMWDGIYGVGGAAGAVVLWLIWCPIYFIEVEVPQSDIQKDRYSTN